MNNDNPTYLPLSDFFATHGRYALPRTREFGTKVGQIPFLSDKFYTRLDEDNVSVEDLPDNCYDSLDSVESFADYDILVLPGDNVYLPELSDLSD